MKLPKTCEKVTEQHDTSVDIRKPRESPPPSGEFLTGIEPMTLRELMGGKVTYELN